MRKHRVMHSPVFNILNVILNTGLFDDVADFRNNVCEKFLETNDARSDNLNHPQTMKETYFL
jgi:hypothetical protein